MRVEICGGIASGKTTLAALLGDHGFFVVREQFESNPFWRAFYANPGRYVFETEVGFLLQHYHEIKKAFESTSQIVVTDFSFELDAAYADMGLHGSQRAAFHTVQQEVQAELGPPDLIVQLCCAADVELSRIRARGRAEESRLALPFLEELNTAVSRRLERGFVQSPILAVDSALVDFAYSAPARERLGASIRAAMAARP